jgi:hypothetical protein
LNDTGISMSFELGDDLNSSSFLSAQTARTIESNSFKQTLQSLKRQAVMMEQQSSNGNSNGSKLPPPLSQSNSFSNDGDSWNIREGGLGGSQFSSAIFASQVGMRE